MKEARLPRRDAYGTNSGTDEQKLDMRLDKPDEQAQG